MRRPSPLRLLARCLAAISLVVGLGRGLADDVPEARMIKEYRQYALAHRGSPDAGEVIFRENRKALCADCHRITGTEKSGPNLAGIAERYTRSELIVHVLLPSLVIKPGYHQANVLMKDGRVLTGRIERSDEQIVRLIDTKGKSNNLRADDVEEVRFPPASLMPTGLVSAITKQQFADLISYLSSLHSGGKSRLGAGIYPVRIPWRYSLSSPGGDLRLGDVGQHAYEEGRSAKPFENHGGDIRERSKPNSK